MDRNTAFYTKLFINRFDHANQEALLSFFPQGKEAVNAVNTDLNDLSSAYKSPSEILDKIHYSWIAEALAKYPKEKVLLFLGAIPEAAARKVKSLLSLEDETPKLKGIFKVFTQKELVKKLLPSTYLPLEYTPKTPLNPLTKLSKYRLILLIDYLGLYDLAEEMKKIVDTKLLKKLTETLSPKQKAFVKQCIQKKDKIQAPPFPLYDWNGEPKELQKKLHKKGLLRLAKALSGQDPQFIWHITHRLDTGRGKKLESLINDDPVAQITESMASKTLQLITYLEKE